MSLFNFCKKIKYKFLKTKMDRKSLFNLPRELLVEIILGVKKQNEKEKEELMRKCVQTRMINVIIKIVIVLK